MKKNNRLTKILTAVVGSLLCLLAFSCKQSSKAYVSSSYEKMIVGTWIAHADELGKSYVTEVFNSDGTWQRGGDVNSIVTTGSWTLEGGDTILIHETGVKVGSTFSPSDNSKVYLIVSIDDTQLSYIDGDRKIDLKRMKSH